MTDNSIIKLKYLQKINYVKINYVNITNNSIIELKQSQIFNYLDYLNCPNITDNSIIELKLTLSVIQTFSGSYWVTYGNSYIPDVDPFFHLDDDELQDEKVALFDDLGIF